jgi:hypothetical protein
MDSKEVELKAHELVDLTIKYKEISDKIKLLKAEIKEYTEIENISETSWGTDNGFVEVVSNTKYKLVDIPAEFEVPSDIAAIDTAQKAFNAKIVLSKEGKKMFKQNYPAITKLMVPTIKKEVKVVV